MRRGGPARPRKDQAAGGAGKNVPDSAEEVRFEESAVEHQESGCIEQEMIPGDVNEWVREQPPPFAVTHRFANKHHRTPWRAEKGRNVEDENERCECNYFGPATHRLLERREVPGP